MRGTLKVVSQEDYDKWVAKNTSPVAGTSQL
jgi:heme/copper-type cytochrome/quinol oxidase subunit 2